MMNWDLSNIYFVFRGKKIIPSFLFEPKLITILFLIKYVKMSECHEEYSKKEFTKYKMHEKGGYCILDIA